MIGRTSIGSGRVLGCTNIYRKYMVKKQLKKKSKNRPRKARGGMTTSSVPAALSTTIVTSDPKISHAPDSKSVRISHSEFVQTATTNTTFTATSSPINPGLVGMFPWLSTLAAAYEQYKFLSLRFVYVPSVGTDFDGFIAMAPEYDVYDAVPINLGEMSAYVGNVMCQSYQRAMVEFDPKSMMQPGPRKYIRKVSSDDEDLQESDAGRLVFASDGHATAAVSGYIFVEYDVELYSPQTGISSRRAPSKLAIFNVGQTGVINSATTTKIEYDTVSFNNTSIQLGAQGIITLPIGQVWEVTVEPCIGTDGAEGTVGTMTFGSDLFLRAQGCLVGSFPPLDFITDLSYIGPGGQVDTVLGPATLLWQTMGDGATSYSCPTPPLYRFFAEGQPGNQALWIDVLGVWAPSGTVTNLESKRDVNSGGATGARNRISFVRVF